MLCLHHCWHTRHMGNVQTNHAMLTNFAHPDRQHQAREQLHKFWQRTSQSATDYVRTINSLVQRAGQPVPSTTDQILFFHSSLLSSFKEKCVTNPTTGMFWTDLHALRGHVIAMQTHGNLKQVELVPKTHTSINTARSFKPNQAFQCHAPHATH